MSELSFDSFFAMYQRSVVYVWDEIAVIKHFTKHKYYDRELAFQKKVRICTSGLVGTSIIDNTLFYLFIMSIHATP